MTDEQEIYYFGTSNKTEFKDTTYPIEKVTVNILEAAYFAKIAANKRGGKPVVYQVIPNPSTKRTDIMQRSKFGRILLKGGTPIEISEEDLEKLLEIEENRLTKEG